MFSQPLLAIIGPTASGKSDLAVRLAKHFHAEIISVDSLQVYKGFDIGTGKITEQEMEGVPHHLLDICDANEHFTAKMFQERADLLIQEITARGKNVILAGGTGLYLNALIKGLFDTPSSPQLRSQIEARIEEEGSPRLYQELLGVDPVYAEKINPNDKIRIVRALEVYYASNRPMSSIIAEHQQQPHRYQSKLLGLQPSRETLYQRIEARVEHMLQAGWLDEIRQHREHGISPQEKAMQCIGYSELNQYLDDSISLDEAIRLIKKHTKTYARRQQTWFKKEPVRWVESADEVFQDQELMSEIKTFLERKGT